MDYQMLVDRKLAKQQNKKKNLIDSQRLNTEDVSDEEELNYEDVMDHNLKKILPHIEGHELESRGDSDLSDSENETRFVNPLL
jgi:hypothetical protein